MTICKGCIGKGAVMMFMTKSDVPLSGLCQDLSRQPARATLLADLLEAL